MKPRGWKGRYRRWRLLRRTCANECGSRRSDYLGCSYMWAEGFAQAVGCPRAHLLYGTTLDKERIARAHGL